MIRYLIFLFLCVSAQAATLYCGPSGTGSGNGSNFSNLLQLPTTTGFTRGNTYIIVEGSYGSRTFSTAASGTTTVTIKKASAADSAVTGYATTLFDGQATFSDLIVDEPYLIVDGVTRTETTRMEEPAGYGIRITGTIEANSLNGNDGSNSQFSYLDVGGTWSESSSPDCLAPNRAVYLVFDQHDITFTRCVFHNAGVNNGALIMAHGSDDITFDHCDFYFGWGKAGIATPNSGQDGHVVRYCRFWNVAQLDTCPATEGEGITTDIGTYSYAGTTTGNLVYGCIFYGTASGGRNAIIQYGESSPGPDAVNCKVFNNTFVGFPENCTVGEIILFGGSGNEAKNNLFWNTTGAVNVTANTASNNEDAASDPFVDSVNLDFRLAAPYAGTSLSAPYDVDPTGATRGADGTWDVGALEFAAGAGGSGSATTINAGTVNVGG